MKDTGDVRSIAVIGSGILGSGITQAFLMGGYENVVLCDISEEALEKSRETIETVIRALESEEKFKAYVTTHPFLGHFGGVDFAELQADRKRVGLIADGISADEILSHLVCKVNLEEAVSHADFVMEVVTERLDIKQEIFRQVGEFAPSHAVCASNTSTLPISKIYQHSHRPENAIGMHFHGFSQAFDRLIEIMGGPKTADESLAIGERVGQSLPSVAGERLVVRLEKEAAGFIANRIAAPAGIYSTWLMDKALEEGITLEQLHAGGIDMRVADFVGLDTAVNAMLSYREHVSPDFAPNKAIVELVSQGRLGKKSGQGFYTWDETGNPVIKQIPVEEKTQRFLSENREPEIIGATRLNEACRLLEMGVVKGCGMITELERIGEGHPGIFENGSEKYQEWTEILAVAAEKTGKSYLKPCEMMKTGKFRDYP